MCGIRDSATVRQVVQLGVDAIGLNFVVSSPRCISLEDAVEIFRVRPVFLSVVALFMDQDASFVRRVVTALRPDYLQFHGSESPGYCAGFGVPYIKAVPMADPERAGICARQHHEQAAALLYDSHAPGTAGGSGLSFVWQKLPRWSNCPVILAGGLTAANVQEAISVTRPYGVDVSSGIERIKGTKDLSLMKDFVECVRRADREVLR